MFVKFALVVLFVALTTASNGFVHDTDVEFYVNSTSCDPEDTSDCTLGCTVYLVDGYTAKECRWKYYVNSSNLENPNVEIFYDIENDCDDFSCNTNLMLTSYYAGCYVCEFTLNNGINNQSICAAIKIQPENKGALIGDKCTTDSDCLALNSTCALNSDNSTVCQCSGNNTIQYNSQTNAPACLALEPCGEHCNLEQQCTRTNEVYDCQDTYCVCNGNWAIVEEEQDQTMCIQIVTPMSLCVYNEQCNGTNSYCDNSDQRTCECVSGYTMNMDNNNPWAWFCYPTDNSLSGGAIAGIVIGSVAGCAIIGGIIYYFMMKNND